MAAAARWAGRRIRIICLGSFAEIGPAAPPSSGAAGGPVFRRFADLAFQGAGLVQEGATSASPPPRLLIVGEPWRGAC